MAHNAVQLATRAARANLTAEADDSHSSLTWDDGRGALMCQPLVGGAGQITVGVILQNLTLVLTGNGVDIANLALSGVNTGEAEKWLDGQLETAGLHLISPISLPYDLPSAAAKIGAYSIDRLKVELEMLSAWFELGSSVLNDLVMAQSAIKPGPSAVRCWPHHFDIATYIGLEQGGSETARGIGVGLSLGDEGYGEPYFYVNPWPHLETTDLPAPPVPGHWHTQGYVGMIATATELLSCPDVDTATADFVVEAFSLGLSHT